MARRWIDAKFEVVGGPYRVGDPHRNPKFRRWLYTGKHDVWGRPLWYRPPRFTRTHLALMVVGVPFAFLACIGGIGMLLAHH